MRRTLRWIPRLLSLLLTSFFSLMALDVFAEGFTFWQTLAALFLHLSPSIVLMALTVVAWIWPLAGGGLFIALAVLLTFLFDTYAVPGAFLAVSLPLLVIGALYLLSAYAERLATDSRTDWTNSTR